MPKCETVVTDPTGLVEHGEGLVRGDSGPAMGEEARPGDCD